MKTNDWFTSDWHVGHEKVLGFCNRPFSSLCSMHHTLVKRYNVHVKEEDRCWFLGDIGGWDTETAKKLLSRMNGTKILITGNHDRGMNSSLSMGFDVVLQSASIKVGQEVVTLSHYPLVGFKREDTTQFKYSKDENWHKENKFKHLALDNRAQFHLHGHIHSLGTDASPKILGKQFDVGVDANNFMPVSKSYIESWIRKYKE